MAGMGRGSVVFISNERMNEEMNGNHVRWLQFWAGPGTVSFWRNHSPQLQWTSVVLEEYSNTASQLIHPFYLRKWSANKATRPSKSVVPDGHSFDLGGWWSVRLSFIGRSGDDAISKHGQPNDS